MAALPYLAFFCSGASGLIYQVVWVRVFGNVFGNTVHSASLVVAVFMLGLGLGGYFAGAWADRRYRADPDSLLRAYAYAEGLIAALGLGVSLVLPHLGALSAAVSSYTPEASGWYVLSLASYAVRVGLAIVLLLPSALLMGATLTLLVRHLVRGDPARSQWRIAALYGINTVGAAVGCVLTDFALVPALGLQGTQMSAVALNVLAAVAVLTLARVDRPAAEAIAAEAPSPSRRRGARAGSARSAPDLSSAPDPSSVAWTGLALALAGFAAMGMEILWFRHISILLGGFRAVFSLLLAVILVGIGVGALLGGWVGRRTARPAQAFMLAQGVFVAVALVGLGVADAAAIGADVTFNMVLTGATGFAGAANISTGWGRSLAEAWFNARPIVSEVGLPALAMGFSFPLANAMIQRVEGAVGRRSGLLYLANTLGAVCGSLATGFALLPWLGIQASATALGVVALAAIVPLWLAVRRGVSGPREAADDAVFGGASDRAASHRAHGVAVGGLRGGIEPVSPRAATLRTTPAAALWSAAGLVIGAAALGWWAQLPADFVNARALDRPSAQVRRLAVSEGLTELIAVTESDGQGRTLVTNGHAMSATTPRSQRYMRALAHLPLLAMDAPKTALVIGFGVGNTTHAVTLHPSIVRVDVADLSRGVLSHASYFTDANHGALSDPRVSVYLNDGRQHLQMQADGTYDLITLEPPPIAFAGVSALYSKEFYTLARSRLTSRGYVSQWLPAYQVPTDATLAMVRAFVDVFPQAVLVSGAEADLILIGTRDSSVTVDPARLLARLGASPRVRADLARLDLGTPREIVGSFLGSATTMVTATREVAPVADDRPMLEYSVRSALNLGEAVPVALVDLSAIEDWCPACFRNTGADGARSGDSSGSPTDAVAGLDLYMALMDLAYQASPEALARTRARPDAATRTLAGSAYLGAVVPESADLHNLLGISLASRGAMDQAIGEFRLALALEPGAAATLWHLGVALASRGQREEALTHLRRSVELDPSNQDARNDLAALSGTAADPAARK